MKNEMKDALQLLTLVAIITVVGGTFFFPIWIIGAGTVIGGLFLLPYCNKSKEKTK